MITQTYDMFNRQEKPELTLCNPNKDELYSLKSGTETIITRRYNAASEISLSFPREVNGEVMPAFDNILQKRLIFVSERDYAQLDEEQFFFPHSSGDDGYGYYIITDVSEDDSGEVPIKRVRGLSLEYRLTAKKLTAFGGTYKFYDVLDPDSSLLGAVLSYTSNWTIGTIDGDLWEKYRTFDVADTNIYNFLMTDVEEAFNCIFTFNTVDMTVSATAIDNATTDTDVYLSSRNVINSSSLKEIADEISTALYVYGGGDLDIRTVNPMGSNIIYNFDYYKTTSWMEQSLIDAIDSWEAAIDALQVDYANNLTNLKNGLANLVVLEGKLVDLNNEWLALEGVMAVRIEAGLWPDTDIIEAMDEKQGEIDLKQAEIENQNSAIDFIRSILDAFSDSLSFENNFTVAEIYQLEYFMFENTYQNENIVQLDSDTPDDVQALSQTLYDQAVLVLGRVSQPRYEFSMDTVSILALPEYQVFTNQLQLGSLVYIEKEGGDILTLVLLKLVFDYDNPAGFSMTFSNRLRLDNGEFIFSDLFGQPVKVGTTVKFDKAKWGNWESTYKNDVTTFINSSLDASVNSIINAENQEIKIYENGLRGRTYDDDPESPTFGTYEDQQVWLTSKTLAFTDDNWDSASLAIGKIEYNEVPVFGVVADAIVGRLIAGNTLSIQNDENNFLLDETGAYLTDAEFVVTKSDNKNKVTISPEKGILIERNPGGTWENVFSVDISGNIIFAGELSGATGVFSGSITAESGSIGGMGITSEGIYVDSTHFIHNDGEIKWGGLHIYGSTADFDGTIHASRLEGEVAWSQITGAPLPSASFAAPGGYSAGYITSGTLSGSRVSGGTITWPGVSMYTGAYGVHYISCNSSLNIQSGDVRTTGRFQAAGQISASNGLSISGNLAVDYKSGITFTAYVGSTAIPKRLYFTKGILTGYSYI